MAKCIYKASGTEMLFEYSHRFYAGNQDSVTTSFEFATSEGNEVNYLWKVECLLQHRLDAFSDDSEAGELDTLCNVEVGTREKLVVGDVAFVTVIVNGVVCFDCKFDSESPSSVERIVPSVSLKSYDESYVQVKVLFYHQDKSIVQVLRNYNKFLENECFSDVRFVFGDIEILAHKQILSENNSAFAEIFKSCVKSDRVEINDVDSDIFKKLLQFVYHGKVYTSDLDDLLELVVAADKYCVTNLVNICEDLIAKNLTTENVVDVFVVASSVNAESLKIKCMTYIFKNNRLVVETDGYKNLIETRRADLLSEILCHFMEKNLR